jgi:hypothetical protein
MSRISNDTYDISYPLQLNSVNKPKDTFDMNALNLSISAVKNAYYAARRASPPAARRASPPAAKRESSPAAKRESSAKSSSGSSSSAARRASSAKSSSASGSSSSASGSSSSAVTERTARTKYSRADLKIIKKLAQLWWSNKFRNSEEKEWFNLTYSALSPESKREVQRLAVDGSNKKFSDYYSPPRARAFKPAEPPPPPHLWGRTGSSFRANSNGDIIGPIHRSTGPASGHVRRRVHRI